jgi:acyl-coenzyme A synthetase/AMP-(fatty) acid ligase
VLPGFEVRIVDDDGRELPRGAEGTLAIRGAACVASYVDDAEGTLRVFRDGWFHPGDLARLDDDGVLVICGRHDERINVGGSKATPEMIESFVLALPGVVDAAAFAYSSAQGLDRVGLAIVADASFDFGTFRSQCEARLGVFTPQTVLRVREIPRNANGKVERRALADLLPAGATGGARTILGR